MPEMFVWAGRVAGYLVSCPAFSDVQRSVLVVSVVVDGGVVLGGCWVVGTHGEGFAGWWLVVAGEGAYQFVRVD